MPLVVDASVAIALVVPDEQSNFAEAVLRAAGSEGGWLIPQIWHFEVANALISASRRNRMDEPSLRQALRELAELPTVVRPVDSTEVLDAVTELAHARALSVYDASYLHLALREGASLATLDDRLRAAARTAGCRVFEPA